MALEMARSFISGTLWPPPPEDGRSTASIRVQQLFHELDGREIVTGTSTCLTRVQGIHVDDDNAWIQLAVGAWT
jgi:hypothetical protein